MLSSFLEWARQVEASRGTEWVEVRVTKGRNSENSSARLDIDKPTAAARITCWRSGDYDAEIIDIESERTLYSCHGVFLQGRPIAEQVSPFFDALDLAVKE